MPTIRVTERETYDEIWAHPAYAAYSPGAELVPFFVDMTHASAGHTVLDAGCGAGQGAMALAAAGLRPYLLDLTESALSQEAQRFPFREGSVWDDIKRLYPDAPRAGAKFDFVYCCDVLEHLPPEFTMLAVARLLAVADQGMFCSIGLTPDNCGMLVGRVLHQTVRPFGWWRDRLADIGHLIEARDRIVQGLYYLKP